MHAGDCCGQKKSSHAVRIALLHWNVFDEFDHVELHVHEQGVFVFYFLQARRVDEAFGKTSDSLSRKAVHLDSAERFSDIVTDERIDVLGEILVRFLAQKLIPLRLV